MPGMAPDQVLGRVQVYLNARAARLAPPRLIDSQDHMELTEADLRVLLTLALRPTKFQDGYEQATADVCRALGVRVDEDQADECPHCDGGHRSPWRRPWAVFVTTKLDRDGQPNSLIVGPSNCAHVAESDAEWLRELIRKAKREHQAEGNRS
jgi:hypothetical protein